MQLDETIKTMNDQVKEKLYHKNLDRMLFGHESTKGKLYYKIQITLSFLYFIVKQRANEIQQVEQQIKKEEKQRQQLYKQMLGSQIEFNKHIKMQGNMTETEKRLNKAQLHAYKQGNMK